MMDEKKMTGRILNHIMEIIYLLTGEDYIVVKKHGEHVTDSSISCTPEGFGRSMKPIMEHSINSPVHERNNDKKLMTEKILEHTNKIIHLLTGEVPIKCDDFAVYFSMEEWEYLGGHNELYEDVMRESHPTFSSLDGSMSRYRNTPAGCHSPLSSPDCVNKDNCVIKNCLRQGTPQRKSMRIMAMESTSCEEGNLTASHIYTLGEHTGTEYASTNIKKCGKKKPEVHNNLSIITYKCSECGNIFNNKSSYTIHKRTHIKQKLYNCAKCQKWFTSNSNLVQHQQLHMRDKSFVCSKCGKYYTSKAHLIRHEKIHTGDKPFVCSECGKGFLANSALVEHKRIHTGEKPFVCPECGRCFANVSNLLVHKRIHTREKSFACSECGKCLTNNSALVKHQRFHTKEKPFVCSECGKCFTSNAILVVHKRSHTGEKPFACSECGKCFSHISNLVVHKKIHTGEKPFACSECGKCFTQNSYLVKHQRVHTKSNMCAPRVGNV